MRPTEHKNVNEYIASQPAESRAVLKRVRSTIRKALPEAEEVISYQIPAYKLHGAPVIFFAGWTHHYALYPTRSNVAAVFKDELAPYKKAKGTIQFPLSEPVPVKLIERIARFRAQEAAERAKASKKR